MATRIGPRSAVGLSSSGGLLPWVLLGLGALAVRLVRLDHSSFWLDEILEIFTVRGTWKELWRSLHWQALQAPLDYVLRKLVESAHPSDAARRLPGVLWGAFCVIPFGILLARRAGKAAGFASTLLLVFAPYEVRYSQEARPYALGLLLLCCSLLFLDLSLTNERWRFLGLLYVCCLGTIYTLYLAGVVLVAAGVAILVEDAFDADPLRRSRARRFLLWSPAFAGALVVGYLPWLPVFLRATRSPPMSVAPSWSTHRLDRFISYFGFAPRDAYPVEYPDLIFAALFLAGVAIALTRPRLRFLVAWGLAGSAVLEFLEHRHPTYDSIFHWLPAGLGLTALAAVTLGWVFGSKRALWAKIALGAFLLFVNLQRLSIYFREGRPDWRPLAGFLAETPASERIFVENPWTQLCLGYYIVGPDWLCCKKVDQREIANLDGDLDRLLAAWDRSRDAWLVLAAGPRSARLRSWARSFPAMSFTTAEGEEDAIVCRLRRPGN